MNEIRGLEHQDRLDEQLYQDYETEDQKKVWAAAWYVIKLLLLCNCCSLSTSLGCTVSRSESALEARTQEMYTAITAITKVWLRYAVQFNC